MASHASPVRHLRRARNGRGGNLPSPYPADNPHTVNLAAFAKDVADGSGGKLTIALHPGASLFKGPDIKRAVATGQAQVGEVLISVHENESAIFGIDVVPFLATSFDDARKLWRRRGRRSSRSWLRKA